GSFSGTITHHSANVQLTFTSPMTETLTLGRNQYAVALGTYTPPGPPSAVNAGSLSAFVSVTPASGGEGGNGSASEPATLTLDCRGFPFIGLYGWLKRKSKD